MHFPLDLFVLIVVQVINISLTLLVFLRNARVRQNYLYGLMAFSVVGWSVANYFTNHLTGYYAQLYMNRVAFLAGYLMVQFVWLFSCYFPVELKRTSWQKITAAVMFPVALALSLSSFVVQDVFYRPERDLTDVKTGGLYLLYVGAILFFLALIISNFVRSYKALNRLKRLQVVFTAIGIVTTFMWVLITSAIIPALTGDWNVSKFGGAGTLFLVGATAYAIIRHKLFDIRLIVARSVAYVLSIFSLGAVYGIIAFISLTTIFDNEVGTVTQRAVNASLAVLLAFLFQPLKRFFDKTSSRLFYRDGYDPQAFLDELNKVLVSNIEIEKLLSKSAALIETNLKSSYCTFNLGGNDIRSRRYIGAQPLDITSKNLEQIRKALERADGTLVFDLIEDEDLPLEKTLMQDNDIALMSSMFTSGESSKRGLNLMFMGPKKSGNVYTNQDVKMLGIVVNELAIAIENALRFEEIQKFNITLQQKIDDATLQLRRTNEKLKALDETKDEFISMASHQLRTPLTSVKGYVSMVLEGDVGKITKQQRALLDQAFLSSQRMVYLIADLLNVSRLRTGKFIIEAKPTQLADVIEGEIQQLEEAAKSKNMTLTYHRPKDFPILNLDETKIRQVIMNFADNALYYTPTGGKIDIYLVDKGQSIEFSVVDNGIGVPAREQHHLFTKFYRANNAQKARPDGTGLGLFMAKKVVVAQGGAIIFRSEEGKGSTFGFSFPKKVLLEAGPSKT